MSNIVWQHLQICSAFVFRQTSLNSTAQHAVPIQNQKSWFLLSSPFVSMNHYWNRSLQTDLTRSGTLKNWVRRELQLEVCPPSLPNVTLSLGIRLYQTTKEVKAVVGCQKLHPVPDPQKRYLERTILGIQKSFWDRQRHLHLFCQQVVAIPFPIVGPFLRELKKPFWLGTHCRYTEVSHDVPGRSNDRSARGLGERKG